MDRLKVLLWIVFIAAVVIRFADAFRPINQASWRESDLASISRNYASEGMNIFEPRIDWRGQTPGYTEMEFPLYPWLTAVTYKVFGIHDYFGRLWAFVFSIGTLLVFLRLSQRYLENVAALFSFTFFAFHPMIVEFSTAIQPEGLMIMFYLAAVYFFLRWQDEEDATSFAVATIATGLTLLAKASSAHIGLLFLVLLFQKYGWALFCQTKVWLFGVLTLVPAVAWSLYARSLWNSYGNSLGVSNEYHWVGWDFFTNSYFVTGIIRSEILYVWVVFGAVLGVFAVWKASKERIVKISIWWLIAIFCLYAIASRTTADEWARYYHIFSIPPAALLFGVGAAKLRAYFVSLFQDGQIASSARFIASILIYGVVSVALLLTLLLEVKQVRAGYLNRRVKDESLECAIQIKPKLENGGLILVSGSNCFDPDGYVVAYNASFMFYWLERKGFNLCIENQSIANVKQFSENGAKYFVAQKSYMDSTPGFENELRNALPVIDECPAFVTFGLAKMK